MRMSNCALPPDQRKAKAVHYLEVLGVVHRKHRQLTRFWGKVQRGCLRCYYGNPVRRRQPQPRLPAPAAAFDDKEENSTAQDENNTSLSFMRTPAYERVRPFFSKRQTIVSIRNSSRATIRQR